jgi:predicted component of type VI protein secretion system
VARYRLRLLLQEFDLPPGETVLGRSPECHVTIDDPLVSREHAKILVTNERVVLRDLGSRNGSKLNGRPVAGEIELHDGDRVRIGNQELVFSRVVAPRRPGRPTGSLRHCRNCQAPYAAEAPSCPVCGYSPGAEDTLNAASAIAPGAGFDRQTWSLQMHVELVEKAISLMRLADAERAIQRIALAVEERLSTNGTIESAQIDPAFTAALRFAAIKAEGEWVRWVLATMRRLDRSPSPAVVEQLTQLPRIVLSSAERHLGELVEWVAARRDPEAPLVHDALANLREGSGRPPPRDDERSG